MRATPTPRSSPSSASSSTGGWGLGWMAWPGGCWHPPRLAGAGPQACCACCSATALHSTQLPSASSSPFSSPQLQPAPPPPPACRSRLPEPIPLPQLVCEVVKQLEGAYALIIKSAVYPGELVACRRGSPLILGMKYGIQVGAALCMLGWAGLVGGGGQWLGGRCSWRSGRLSAVHQTACAWWVPYDRQSACSYLALPPPPGCSPAVLEPPRPAGRRHAPHPPQPLHPAHPQDDRLLCPRAPVL